ncbi:MAG: prepilin-type N-terminal cleavage/methylation domain-containing protein [Verrucomicrobia bacterium]|nr:MAG: prepilin-type N-terminal cleavage/methylation domain-containing protein [Verrucomicrobiota bacterium]
MDCTITTTKIRTRGMTLVEVLMAVGVSGLVFAAVATQMFSSGRSFAALANYVALDSSSRNALDTMTKEIRQADRLTDYKPTRLQFDTINGALTYEFEPSTRTLKRTQAGQTMMLLTEVDSLQFSMFQRNPVGGSVDQYSTTDPSLCKVVQISWSCSRQILGKKATTESVQSAKVVIRKE